MDLMSEILDSLKAVEELTKNLFIIDDIYKEVRSIKREVKKLKKLVKDLEEKQNESENNAI